MDIRNPHLKAAGKRKNVSPDYQCDICPKRVMTLKSLKNHKRAIHEKTWKKTPCSLCDSSFYSKANLRDHIASAHTMETPFHCGMCPQAFKTSTARSHHRRFVHREKNVMDSDGVIHCRFCGKKYNHVSTLSAHQARNHNPSRKTNPRRHKCNICWKRFEFKAGLECHIRTHTQERPFKCPEPGCKRTFTQAGHCSEHFKTHQDARLGTVFPCPVCPKICTSRKILSHHKSQVHRKAPNTQPKRCYFCGCTFSNKGSLKYHLRRHTLEKPYECYFCSKRVATNDALRTHVKMHTNERPHHCKVCGVRYKHLATIRRHAKIPTSCGVKRNRKMYKKKWGRSITCLLCQKTFSFHQFSLYETHIRAHLGERPFRCNYSGCGKTYTNQGVLTQHLKEHRDIESAKVFPCSECHKVCSTLNKLYKHRSYHHDKPDHLQPKTCYFCGNSLRTASALVVHLRPHTLEKPFCCEAPCVLRFSDTSALRKHAKFCVQNLL